MDLLKSDKLERERVIVKALPNIGKPATRALNNVGLTHLEALSQVSAQSVAKLHGVGPKAIIRLEEALKVEGLAFGPDQELAFETDFLAIGDLNCDNAPKRRGIRDFLLAAWMQDVTLTSNYLSSKAQFAEATQAQPLMGIEKILTAYQTATPISSIIIHQLVSHGKEGAAHASLTLQSGHQIHFAEFYQFEGHRKEAKLLKITRYLHSSSESSILLLNRI